MSTPIWPQVVSAVGSAISALMAAIAAWLSRSAIKEMRDSHRAEAEAREQTRLHTACTLVARLADEYSDSLSPHDRDVKVTQRDLHTLLVTALEWPLPECRKLSVCPLNQVAEQSVSALKEIDDYVLERIGGDRRPLGRDWPDIRRYLTNLTQNE